MFLFYCVVSYLLVSSLILKYFFSLLSQKDQNIFLKFVFPVIAFISLWLFAFLLWSFMYDYDMNEFNEIINWSHISYPILSY